MNDVAVTISDASRREALRSALATPPSTKGGALWLVVTIGLFAFLSFDGDWERIALVIAVLLIHELGHLAGMKAFGFSDLKMFFIPFFGAAASGRKVGASASVHAVVLLLGPLPGILIGCALLVAANFVAQPLLLEAGILFVSINAFNLIPVSPLDGGRLFERLLFVRRVWLEIVFRWFAIAGLVALAVALESVVLGVLAFFLLVGAGQHHRLARIGARLRASHGAMSANASELRDDQLDALDEGAREAVQGTMTDETRDRIRAMNARALWERLTSAPASVPSTIGLLGVWLFGLVVTFVGLVAWSLARGAG